MTDDPASLDNLLDLVEPPPVSWWPPAPGWWVIGCLVAIAAAAWCYGVWRRWRQNAYRRAAIQELSGARDEAEIAALLKRAALEAYPREEVASLSGPAWCEWLQRTSGLTAPPAVIEGLTRGVYRGSDHAANGALASFARDWIRGHHGPAPPSSQPS